MGRKKVLIISFIFPPQLLARALQLLKTANALIKLGWDVTVYTADPKLLKDPIDSALAEKIDPAIHIIPGYTLENWFFSNATASLSLGMPDDKYLWRFAGKKALQKILEKENFDVIASFGLQWSSHLLALEVKKFSNLPWLAHFSDPWVDNAYHKRIWPISAINRKQERAVCETAEALCFTTEATHKLVTEKYGANVYEKGLVVPHCFDKSLYPHVAENQDNVLSLVHVGSFYGRHNPNNFLEAFALFKKENPKLAKKVLVTFVGLDGAKYKTRLTELNIAENFSFVGKVPYLESLAYMKKATVLFSIDVVSKSLLSKLPDYIGANKPLLAISDPGSPTFLYVEKLHGLTADQQDVPAIASALKKLSACWEKDSTLSCFSYTDEEAAFFDSLRTTSLLSSALEKIANKEKI